MCSQLITPFALPLIDGALSNAELDAFAKDTNGDVVREKNLVGFEDTSGTGFFFSLVGRDAKEKRLNKRKTIRCDLRIV